MKETATSNAFKTPNEKSTRSSMAILPSSAMRASGLATTTNESYVSRLDHIMRVERVAFAAKLRASRAILGLSQEQLALEVGLTQKSVHRIEHGDVQPKTRTILIIEQFWRRQGISFENLSNGGFRLIVESSVLLRSERPGQAQH